MPHFGTGAFHEAIRVWQQSAFVESEIDPIAMRQDVRLTFAHLLRSICCICPIYKVHPRGPKPAGLGVLNSGEASYQVTGWARGVVGLLKILGKLIRCEG